MRVNVSSNKIMKILSVRDHPESVQAFVDYFAKCWASNLKIYLSTDLIGYYEKLGFVFIGNGFHPWGDVSRIYEKQIAVASEPD